MSDCQYCKEFNGAPPHELVEAGMPRDRIISRNDDLVLMPTVGCIVPGYMILSPVDHYYSFGQMEEDDLLCDLPDIADRIQHAIKKVMGCQTLIAEHGSTFCETGAACCDHAHLHFIPIPSTAYPTIWERYCHAGRLDRMEVVESLLSFSHRPYVLYSEDAVRFAVWEEPDRDRRFGSQFCRKVAAEIWGMPNGWNWRDAPFFQNMKITLERFKDELKGVLG